MLVIPRGFKKWSALYRYISSLPQESETPMSGTKSSSRSISSQIMWGENCLSEVRLNLRYSERSSSIPGITLLSIKTSKMHSSYSMNKELSVAAHGLRLSLGLRNTIDGSFFPPPQAILGLTISRYSWLTDFTGINQSSFKHMSSIVGSLLTPRSTDTSILDALSDYEERYLSTCLCREQLLCMMSSLT